MTVQPTEQWVQIALRTSTAAPAAGGGPASALRTPASGSAPSVARPPATRPERRRKARRSRPPPVWLAKAAASEPRRASRSVLLISTTLPSSFRRIAVDPVIGLDVIGLAIAALALLVVGLAVGLGGRGERGPGRRRRARAAPRDAPPFVILTSSTCPPCNRHTRRSCGQREGFHFDFDEHPTDHADAGVEIRRFGALEVGEEAADPRRQVALEQALV